MKTNIRQHLVFHIHIPVVSLCQLGIVLFNAVVFVSVVRSCPSPSRLCRVVSLCISISFLLVVVSQRTHLSCQTTVYSIPHDKELLTKEELPLKNNNSTKLDSCTSIRNSRTTWQRLSEQTTPKVTPNANCA